MEFVGSDNPLSEYTLNIIHNGQLKNEGCFVDEKSILEATDDTLTNEKSTLNKMLDTLKLK